MFQHDGAHLIRRDTTSPDSMTQSDHLTTLVIGQAYVESVNSVSSGAVTSSEQLGDGVHGQIQSSIDASWIVFRDGVAVTRGIDGEAFETFHYLFSKVLYCSYQ